MNMIVMMIMIMYVKYAGDDDYDYDDKLWADVFNKQNKLYIN